VTRFLPCTIVVALCAAASSNAQSLADLARQEAARRRTIMEPSHVYTNADLKPATVSGPAEAILGAPTSASTGETTLPPDNGATAIEDAASRRSDFCPDCVRDASGRINRSDAAKREFWRLTGFPNGRSGWEVDHIIPLACGGSDAPSNMQWRTKTEAAAMNRTERESCPRDYEPSVPVVSQPVLVLPGRTCGVNTPREQAMANAIAGGSAPIATGQPCDPSAP
jgi:hypothetical protein